VLLRFSWGLYIWSSHADCASHALVFGRVILTDDPHSRLAPLEDFPPASRAFLYRISSPRPAAPGNRGKWPSNCGHRAIATKNIIRQDMPHASTSRSLSYEQPMLYCPLSTAGFFQAALGILWAAFPPLQPIEESDVRKQRVRSRRFFVILGPRQRIRVQRFPKHRSPPQSGPQRLIEGASLLAFMHNSRKLRNDLRRDWMPAGFGSGLLGHLSRPLCRRKRVQMQKTARS
jgi:hypothetical protein